MVLTCGYKRLRQLTEEWLEQTGDHIHVKPLLIFQIHTIRTLNKQKKKNPAGRRRASITRNQSQLLLALTRVLKQPLLPSSTGHKGQQSVSVWRWSFSHRTYLVEFFLQHVDSRLVTRNTVDTLVLQTILLHYLCTYLHHKWYKLWVENRNHTFTMRGFKSAKV